MARRCTRLYDDQGLLARGVIHGAPLHQVVGQWSLGIAERDTAIVAQARHVAELFAAQAARERADRVKVRLVAEHFVTVMDQFHRSGIVDRRLGIGWQTKRSDTVPDRGQGLALDIGLLGLSRVAQPRLAIDQTRHYPVPAGVDRMRGLEARGSLVDADYLAILQVQVGRALSRFGGCYHEAVFDMQAHELAPD
jgi:hypothetical protein